MLMALGGSFVAEGEGAGAQAEIRPAKKSGARVFMIESVGTLSIA
jgi:hypothetical protein